MAAPDPWRIARLPDEWQDLGGALPTPIACWDVSWPTAPRDALAVNLLRLQREAFGAEEAQPQDDTGPHADADVLPRFAAGLAVHLMGLGMPTARDWFAALPWQPARELRYPYADEVLAELCGRAALRIARALAQRGDDSFASFRAAAAQSIEQESRRFEGLRPNDGTIDTVLHAIGRGIPVRRIVTSAAVYRFGDGSAQRRLWRGFTQSTSHIGTVMATRKDVTNELLRTHGFPVPRQALARDFEAARRAAAAIGWPVIVKPAASDFGTAVTTNIRDEAALQRAFTAARAHGIAVVENHVPGEDYRFTVLGGQCFSVLLRLSARVTGNGRDSIAVLMARYAEERRRDPQMRSYRAASLDDPLVAATLSDQGLSPKDVPPEGRVVLLRTNSNVSTGGVSKEVKEATHPDNLRLAERAAACLGLDHAGIDFLTTDVSRSWREVGGAICEVNPTPARVSDGGPKRVVDHLFPHGGNGRIPVIVVVAAAAEAARSREAIEAYARSRGLCLGAVFGGDAFAGPLAINAARGASTADLVRMVLGDTSVDIALVQVEADVLLAQGLPLACCDVAVFEAEGEAKDRILQSRLSVLGRSRAIVTGLEPSPLLEALETLMPPVTAAIA
ncbi:MAG TPA: hypothetical protein VHA82_16230 [Ramlibacter sp.]|uniref:hypothetical protein n=1 Tax=Ramlibacter sp. TaxID=1917967 RepID=UPI002C625DE0|nr:hypothetical protein [Ramlibacter sp.]HVZ45360.1 hypothetical protein [Ramlibacter sp.]